MNCFSNNCRRIVRGFTFIEIILVVLVLGILAGLSIPNFSHTYQRLQLRKTAEDLAYLMRYAQSRAITTNFLLRLEFDSQYTSYWLSEKEIEDSPLASYQRLSSQFGRVFHIPSKVSVQSDHQTIDFYPDGNIAKQSITVCSFKQCMVVSTKEQRGSVYVYEASE